MTELLCILASIQVLHSLKSCLKYLFGHFRLFFFLRLFSSFQMNCFLVPLKRRKKLGIEEKLLKRTKASVLKKLLGAPSTLRQVKIHNTELTLWKDLPKWKVFLCELLERNRPAGHRRSVETLSPDFRSRFEKTQQLEAKNIWQLIVENPFTKECFMMTINVVRMSVDNFACAARLLGSIS